MNYSEQKYGDILNMPHHVSATRPQMPMSDRAAQFSPFAALTGYDAAIKETGRLTDTKIELDDEELHSLNLKFQFLVEHLEDEPEVAVTYFKADERKAASLRVRPAKMGEGAFGYLIPIRVLLNNTDIVEATMMVGAITAEMITAA